MPDPRATIESLRLEGSETDGRLVLEDPSKQFLYENLVELQQDLKTFRERTMKRVEQSLSWCRSVRKVTIDDHVAEWARVTEAIGHDTAFRGTNLSPQEGLTPLGPDLESKLEEFLVARTGNPPKPGTGSHWKIDEDTGIVLVLLPGGRRTMIVATIPTPLAARGQLTPSTSLPSCWRSTS